MKKYLVLANYLIILSCTSNMEDKEKNTAYHFIQENEKRYQQDSLLFSDQFVKDTVLLELFWKGNYDKIVAYKDSLLTKRGNAILSIALIEEDIEFFEKNVGRYLPEVLLLNVIKGKESFEDLNQDRKYIGSLSLYKKYAIYLYLSNKFTVPMDFIGNYIDWFYPNKEPTDPIIYNEFLYIVSKFSEEKEATGYIAEYLDYTDSLIQVYPENDHLKEQLASVWIDLEEYDKAIQIYKDNFRKTRNIDFLYGALLFYQQIQPNKDSLEKYEEILMAHPEYREPKEKDFTR